MLSTPCLCFCVDDFRLRPRPRLRLDCGSYSPFSSTLPLGSTFITRYNLMWINLAAEVLLYSATPEVDWLRSMGLDHALIRCLTFSNSQISGLPKEEVSGYKPDSGKIKEWVKEIVNSGHFVHLPPMNLTTDCDLAVDVLFDAIESASEKVFEKCYPSRRNKCAR